MRKRVFAICEQQRLRSDCASTQSDQQFCGSLLCSILPIVAGERGSSVVECRTPEREVRGSRPTSAVLCP